MFNSELAIAGYYLERYKMSQTTIQDHTRQNKTVLKLQIVKSCNVQICVIIVIK